jgi:small multidrug resistance pump
MARAEVAIAITIGLCFVSVVGDYFIKRASDQPLPFQSWWFLVGLFFYSSTAFGWVYVMQHLRFATLGSVFSVSSVLMLAVVGVLFLGESLQWKEVVGIALAILSILLLTRFAE